MNTETDFKTQNNSPYSSDDDEYEYEYEYKIQNEQADRNEIFYHVDPEGVIKFNPDLEGKVFQAYLLCNLCHQYKK